MQHQFKSSQCIFSFQCQNNILLHLTFIIFSGIYLIPTIRKHTQKIQCTSTACQQVDPTQRLSQVSWLSASSPPPDAPPTTTPCDGWLRFWPSSLQASIPASTGSGTPHSTSPLPEMVHGLTATSRGGGTHLAFPLSHGIPTFCRLCTTSPPLRFNGLGTRRLLYRDDTRRQMVC